MSAQRMNYGPSAATEPLSALHKYSNQNGFDPKLRELVRTRVSQINGCAYCIDMHTKDARAEGETEQRLYALSAWRETPFFSARERAALEWAECLTRISENDVSDELYERVQTQFPGAELLDLSMLVIEINSWNRLAIPFRSVPGSYKRP